MIRLHILKLNGVKHTAYRTDAGEVIYDPPIPAALQDRHEARLSEMLETQSPPRIMTENVASEGLGSLLSQFDGDARYVNQITSNAKAHGYTPGTFDVYQPNLARFPGDPEAFCAAGDFRSHTKKVCQKRGLPCEGAVNLPGSEPRPAKRTRLADDIVRRKSRELARKETKASPQDLAAEVIHRHGAKPD
jgi:hypothetical protein